MAGASDYLTMPRFPHSGSPSGFQDGVPHLRWGPREATPSILTGEAEPRPPQAGKEMEQQGQSQRAGPLPLSPHLPVPIAGAPGLTATGPHPWPEGGPLMWRGCAQSSHPCMLGSLLQLSPPQPWQPCGTAPHPHHFPGPGTGGNAKLQSGQVDSFGAQRKSEEQDPSCPCPPHMPLREGWFPSLGSPLPQQAIPRYGRWAPSPPPRPGWPPNVWQGERSSFLVFETLTLIFLSSAWMTREFLASGCPLSCPAHSAAGEIFLEHTKSEPCTSTCCRLEHARRLWRCPWG